MKKKSVIRRIVSITGLIIVVLFVLLIEFTVHVVDKSTRETADADVSVMAEPYRNLTNHITEEHRKFMLRVFCTDDIYEVDRRDANAIGYAEEMLMPYICGDYGEEASELAEDIIDFLYMADLPRVTEELSISR